MFSVTGNDIGLSSKGARSLPSARSRSSPVCDDACCARVKGTLEAHMTDDWAQTVGDLERLLKLRSNVFAMKLFERREDMEAIERIRRPKAVHTLDQVVGQASRLGWTVGITSDDLVGDQCRAVVGLGGAKTDQWMSGQHMNGVWYSTLEDAGAHQKAMHCVEDGRYEALAVGPLGAKIADPDIALFYATP